jgi:hypothetical protein
LNISWKISWSTPWYLCFLKCIFDLWVALQSELLQAFLKKARIHNPATPELLTLTAIRGSFFSPMDRS